MLKTFEFDLLLQTRLNMLEVTEKLTLQEWNTIPFGFKNAIAWNFCHSIVVMHILTYKLSGQTMPINEEMITPFLKGTKPDLPISEKVLNSYKQIAIESVAALKSAYLDQVFVNFTPYETSYHIKLNTIEDAIRFNNVHEGLHYGYILALKKALVGS